MKISLLENNDISQLEEVLMEGDRIVPVSYNWLKKFSQNDISAFCVKHGIYQIPTIELIEALQILIEGFKTIEIGAGNGSIGRALKIPITDNKLQERPKIAAYYNSIGQTPIKYPDDIIKMGGNHAVKTLKPDCVIASWVTDKKNGNYYGINEAEIVKSVKLYIHIGNSKTHANKEILQLFPYNVIRAKWLVSRSLSYDENIIYIFRK